VYNSILREEGTKNFKFNLKIAGRMKIKVENLLGISIS